jgi:malto-oligosyltrehalose trehalohydrolase
MESIDLFIEGDIEPLRLQRGDDGWHSLITRRAKAGDRYRYILPDGTRVPDPASCFQPEDIDGPSQVIDHSAYRWRESRWKGRPWHTAVIYEMHVGAFSQAGTFEAVREQLPRLAQLGVTAIQLMPIGDFPGLRNWGYDGVLPYAPDHTYGSPDDLKALIEHAHGLGLMVLLDVVYNHFGPVGNYLGRYAPQFFTDRHHTPWGAALNFDGEHSRPVRDFVIGNALYWLENFRFDGLRLDAVHHLRDNSPKHILTELAEVVRARIPHRQVHLVLENEENQARLLERSPHGEVQLYNAQWNDDLHHVLHTAVSGEGHGYYKEYLGDTSKLARAVAEGFAFQGERMCFRDSARGEPSAHLPPDAFVGFLQNHDQIGNRAYGERLGHIAPEAAMNAAVAVYLLMPQVPLLFMGEEWNAAQCFPFFCHFEGELGEAIREGRRKEFASFPAFGADFQGEPLPDATAPATFAAAKLDWVASESLEARRQRERYGSLLELRHREIIPRIPSIGRGGVARPLAPSAIEVIWQVGVAEEIVLVANLSAESVDVPLPKGRVLWLEGSRTNPSGLNAWSVLWILRARAEG